mmetsp:Transcript_39574/g.60488  ORF Transcript_39574/g.60488 Transcript_39574/m.60488 type:complete len:304 (+) Transcript_39574:1273-2184(+)
MLTLPNLPAQFLPFKNAIESCSQETSDEKPLSVYVTKMQPFGSRLYDIATRALEKSPDSQRLIAVARVFSGTLKVGQKIFVMGARHGINGQKDVKEVEIQHLFLLMGASFKLVDKAPAGSIIGIGGLEDILLKSGTISSSPNCPNFTKQQAISMGLVKVSIEPENGADMDELKIALMKLNKADPSVQFYVNNRGEYILSTCGEIHLQRCLKDMKDDFCPPTIKFTVSDPIIPYRETILNRQLKNRIVKGSKQDYEEQDSDSSSEEEEKKKEEMTVQELLEHEKELEQMNEQLTYEKELLKKEK